MRFRSWAILVVVSVGLLVIPLAGQAPKQAAVKPAAQDERVIKTWKVMPVFMENIQGFQKEINQLWEKKLNEIKQTMKQMKGYEDLPDDAVLDPETGSFVRKEDVGKILAQRIKAAELAATQTKKPAEEKK